MKRSAGLGHGAALRALLGLAISTGFLAVSCDSAGPTTGGAPSPDGPPAALQAEDAGAARSSGDPHAPSSTDPVDAKPGERDGAAALSSSAGQPAASSSSGAAASASAEGSSRALPDPLVLTLEKSPAALSFEEEPFYFTAAFDGSLRYSLWLRMLNFSRALGRSTGRAPHFTFFINSCFFSTKPGKSDIGKAMSRDEVLVRRALAQIAINEGHDIANHGMGHLDGTLFTKEEWLTELARFHGAMDGTLFEPVLDEGGLPVFPRFEAIAEAAPRAYGATCATAADCESGLCAMLSATAGPTGICSQACNIKARCPTGSACGAPMFRSDTDLCLPTPRAPIEHLGETLIDARGEPNLKHPSLKKYVIRGFRAPYLGSSDTLYEALGKLGYAYDTSQSASPGPPYWISPRTEKKPILEFALMVHPGALTIPMDYNYGRLRATGARMEADYRAAILSARGRQNVPFNVGHHFAEWEEGAYVTALEKTVAWVIAGCDDACPKAEVISFRELDRRVRQAAPFGTPSVRPSEAKSATGASSAAAPPASSVSP